MESASDKPRDLFLGQVLQSAYQPGVGYRLEERLGEGGTALAYLARRTSPDGESQVVIKLILPKIAADSDERALTIIKKEAVALGRLNERIPPTPFVVRLLDTGSLPFRSHGRTLELPFIALEYVHGGLEGTTLADRVEYSLKATGFAFDPERAARLISSLAKGLDEIHAVGVVHRDLSPGNVLCCGAGETEIFKISDFGIARPAGLTATFGNMLIGTPGYLAPEQITQEVGVGPATDIFSFACIVYYVLSGDPLFEARMPMQALLAARAPERRSLRDAPTLAYELREREAACQAIDLAIARATSPDPRLRPRSAQRFAESLLPWLMVETNHARPSRRWVSSMNPLRSRELVIETNWMVRHPPGDDRIVRDLAWNAAGHALAATTRALEYWDGTRWNDLPPAGLPPPSSLRLVERMSAATWVIGGEHAQLFEYSRDGVRELFRGPDPSVTFTAIAPDFDDIAVVVGEKASSPPLLYAIIGRRWLRPLPVPEATLLTSVARIDDERFLVVGRGADGGPYAACYRPLDWQIERFPVQTGRALLGTASRPERSSAVAVGVGGACLEIEDGALSQPPRATLPDLSCIAIDPLGRQWAAGPGRVWSRRASGTWNAVWEHDAWHPPFVSIMAEIGTVIAMTVDGAVLECRSQLLDKTIPAL